MKKLKYIPLALITTFLLLQAVEVQTPKIGDAMRQAQYPKEQIEPKKEKLVPIKGIKPIYKPMLKDDNSGKKVLIKSFKIVGNKHIKSDVLLTLLKPYLNKKLSFADMKQVASLITKRYRQESYIVARAYIPVQSMKNTTLEIDIIEGTFGKFYLQNHSKMESTYLQSILDINQAGNVISSNALEKPLLFINDIAGVRVDSINIKAGKNVGSSDFEVSVYNTKAYNAYIMANNYGGRYTGKKQFMTGMTLNNPLGLGDRLSVTGLITNGKNLLNGVISYSLPLNRHGLSVEAGYTATSYTLTGKFANLNSLGYSRGFYITAHQPLLRHRAQTADLSLRVEDNSLSDEIRSANYKSDKTSTLYRLRLDYIKTNFHIFSIKQYVNTSLTGTQGKLTFKDQSQSALDRQGINTQGTYAKVQLALQYNLYPTQKLSFENKLNVQHILTDKNLDGSEDFSVGGAYGVKLYPVEELSAENGYVYTAEMNYLFAQDKRFSQKVGVFYDVGRAYMQKPIATFTSRTLQDAGISYYTNYKDFFLKLFVAWKVDKKKVESEPDQNYKVLIMGGLVF